MHGRRRTLGGPGSPRKGKRTGLLVAVVVAMLAGIALPAVSAGADSTPGLAEARAQANAAAAQMSQLETDLAGLDDDIAQLEAEKSDAEAQLGTLRSRVQEIAVRRYTDVGQEPLFLAGADINEQERASALAAIVTQDNTDAIDEYRATQDRLDRASKELERKQSSQQAKLDAQAAQRDKLDAELSRLEQLDAQRVAEERKAAEERAQQAADAQARDQASRQAEQLKGLQDATKAGKAGGATTSPGTAPTGGSTTPAPPIASGAFVCPVQGPRSFVDSWLAPRPGGVHHGIDIMSPRGTPVVIPVTGTVVTKSGGIGGLQFHLNGDDGNFYYGAHMDSFSGAQGHLPAGTVVGYVGDTGDAAGKGTHLHFEIHIGGYGHPINPYPTIATYC